MKPKEILLVSEESRELRSIMKFLRDKGFLVHTAAGTIGIERHKQRHNIDVLVFMEPQKVMSKLKELSDGNGCPIILVSDERVSVPRDGGGSLRVHWLREAFQPEEFLSVLEECFSSFEDEENEDSFCQMVAKSSCMKRIWQMIKKVAETDTTVLITGESGTGKELVARAIHRISKRKNKPFIAVNCGAIPENLLESELFGHMRGSFTGATSDYPGKLEAARGGTIFLDEISEMSLSVQVKFLRVVQEKEYIPIGSNQLKRADVRIISATNQELMELVEKKLFREDLYYRLNIIPIHIPPLRERREDIPLLAEHFIKKYNQLYSGQIEGFSPSAMELLFKYHWKGNIRELENLIARMVVIKNKGTIELADLPEEFLDSKFKIPDQIEASFDSINKIDLKRELDELEKKLILKALELSNGNKNKAASLLNVNRTTLIEKLKRKNFGTLSKFDLQNRLPEAG